MIEPVTKDVLGALGLNGKLFMAQLFNFGIVLFVMWRFVYRPLLALMDKRTKEIQDGLKHAQDAKVRLADAQAEKERILKDARVAAQEILKETQDKAESLRQEKMSQAKMEIEKIVLETKQQIKEERDAAFVALKGEIGSLVTLAIGKVAQGMNTETHKNLIKDAINEIKTS
ncbi:F0F1 ATP synthase subunit B [Candidatus Uhrbacteria bacterium]|nr:F0F1 ATP synthase subunit B [Candidatus Uhrbacteria bacterium]